MEQTEELVEREFLCGDRVRKQKNLNIEDIYKDFDKGLSWKEVCQKHGASESTIRRRHREYQERVKALKKNSDLNLGLNILRELEAAGVDYKLPDLPKEI